MRIETAEEEEDDVVAVVVDGAKARAVVGAEGEDRIARATTTTPRAAEALDRDILFFVVAFFTHPSVPFFPQDGDGLVVSEKVSLLL